MTKPQFTIKTESDNANVGRFIIEPLPQGFGDTLGNSIRRVLYTAIPGAAITSVHINGVNHQFTSLEGMQEDVVQLILSLKQVRVAFTGEKPAKITLDAVGPGPVLASAFDTDSEVKITNPDFVIAHLADKTAKLHLEATVESGFGYSPADDRKSTTVGVIPVDATFTPIVRANYKVESTRVGRITNFDKLILEITTDGSVTPAQALTSASQTLVNYFNGIVNPDTTDNVKTVSGSTQRPPVGANISVEELDLPTRIANALQKAGFQSVADLLAVSRSQLSKVKNLGGKSVEIIEAALKERNFSLAQ
jgi:DNA-directed RNA polymerase subunit alpha